MDKLKQFVEGLVNQPRWRRIFLTAFIALMITLAIFPLVDNIYLRFLFTPETVILPSLVTATIGLIVYFIGWQLLVGSSGSVLSVTFKTWLYLLAGLMATIIVIFLVIQGLIILNQPT